MIPAENNRLVASRDLARGCAIRMRHRESTLKTVDTRKPLLTAIVAAAFLMPFVGRSQNPFPEGQVRDTVVLVCSQCHPLTRIIEGDLTAAEWEFTLYDMIARGAAVHAEDLDLVRQYLIDNFAIDTR